MDIFRVVLALIILAYACYSDIRKRSVSNVVWLVMAGAGIAFAGYGAIVQGMSFLIPLVLCAIITIAVSYAFFRLGLFGAADAKALICIVLLFPTQPGFIILSHHFPLFDLSVLVLFPFALMVLLNAAVLALAVPIHILFRNLHSSGLKEFTGNGLMCFIAYKANIDELRSDGFSRLAYKYDEIDGHLTTRYSLGGIPLNSATIGQLMIYHQEGKIDAEVWVTPELPFILFIAPGFLTGCLLGV
jgi:preflagellin peptidase FlaK